MSQMGSGVKLAGGESRPVVGPTPPAAFAVMPCGKDKDYNFFLIPLSLTDFRWALMNNLWVSISFCCLLGFCGYLECVKCACFSQKVVQEEVQGCWRWWNLVLQMNIREVGDLCREKGQHFDVKPIVFASFRFRLVHISFSYIT